MGTSTIMLECSSILLLLSNMVGLEQLILSSNAALPELIDTSPSKRSSTQSIKEQKTYLLSQLYAGRCLLFIDLCPSVFSMFSLLSSIPRNYPSLQSFSNDDESVQSKDEGDKPLDDFFSETSSEESQTVDSTDMTEHSYEESSQENDAHLQHSIISEQLYSQFSSLPPPSFPSLSNLLFMCRFLSSPLLLLQTRCIVAIRSSDMTSLLRSSQFTKGERGEGRWIEKQREATAAHFVSSENGDSTDNNFSDSQKGNTASNVSSAKKEVQLDPHHFRKKDGKRRRRHTSWSQHLDSFAYSKTQSRKSKNAKLANAEEDTLIDEIRHTLTKSQEEADQKKSNSAGSFENNSSFAHFHPSPLPFHIFDKPSFANTLSIQRPQSVLKHIQQQAIQDEQSQHESSVPSLHTENEAFSEQGMSEKTASDETSVTEESNSQPAQGILPVSLFLFFSHSIVPLYSTATLSPLTSCQSRALLATRIEMAAGLKDFRWSLEKAMSEMENESFDSNSNSCDVSDCDPGALYLTDTLLKDPFVSSFSRYPLFLCSLAQSFSRFRLPVLSESFAPNISVMPQPFSSDTPDSSVASANLLPSSSLVSAALFEVANALSKPPLNWHHLPLRFSSRLLFLIALHSCLYGITPTAQLTSQHFTTLPPTDTSSDRFPHFKAGHTIFFPQSDMSSLSVLLPNIKIPFASFSQSHLNKSCAHSKKSHVLAAFTHSKSSSSLLPSFGSGNAITSAANDMQHSSTSASASSSSSSSSTIIADTSQLPSSPPQPSSFHERHSSQDATSSSTSTTEHKSNEIDANDEGSSDMPSLSALPHPSSAFSLSSFASSLFSRIFFALILSNDPKVELLCRLAHRLMEANRIDIDAEMVVSECCSSLYLMRAWCQLNGQMDTPFSLLVRWVPVEVLPSTDFSRTHSSCSQTATSPSTPMHSPLLSPSLDVSVAASETSPHSPDLSGIPLPKQLDSEKSNGEALKSPIGSTFSFSNEGKAKPTIELSSSISSFVAEAASSPLPLTAKELISNHFKSPSLLSFVPPEAQTLEQLDSKWWKRKYLPLNISLMIPPVSAVTFASFTDKSEAEAGELAIVKYYKEQFSSYSCSEQKEAISTSNRNKTKKKLTVNSENEDEVKNHFEKTENGDADNIKEQTKEKEGKDNVCKCDKEKEDNKKIEIEKDMKILEQEMKDKQKKSEEFGKDGNTQKKQDFTYGCVREEDTEITKNYNFALFDQLRSISDTFYMPAVTYFEAASDPPSPIEVFYRSECVEEKATESIENDSSCSSEEGTFSELLDILANEANVRDSLEHGLKKRSFRKITKKKHHLKKTRSQNEMLLSSKQQMLKTASSPDTLESAEEKALRNLLGIDSDDTSDEGTATQKGNTETEDSVVQPQTQSSKSATFFSESSTHISDEVQTSHEDDEEAQKCRCGSSAPTSYFSEQNIRMPTERTKHYSIGAEETIPSPLRNTITQISGEKDCDAKQAEPMQQDPIHFSMGTPLSQVSQTTDEEAFAIPVPFLETFTKQLCILPPLAPAALQSSPHSLDFQLSEPISSATPQFTRSFHVPSAHSNESASSHSSTHEPSLQDAPQNFAEHSFLDSSSSDQELHVPSFFDLLYQTLHPPILYRFAHFAFQEFFNAIYEARQFYRHALQFIAKTTRSSKNQSSAVSSSDASNQLHSLNFNKPDLSQQKSQLLSAFNHAFLFTSYFKSFNQWCNPFVSPSLIHSLYLLPSDSIVRFTTMFIKRSIHTETILPTVFSQNQPNSTISESQSLSKLQTREQNLHNNENRRKNYSSSGNLAKQPIQAQQSNALSTHSPSSLFSLCLDIASARQVARNPFEELAERIQNRINKFGIIETMLHPISDLRRAVLSDFRRLTEWSENSVIDNILPRWSASVMKAALDVLLKELQNEHLNRISQIHSLKMKMKSYCEYLNEKKKRRSTSSKHNKVPEANSSVPSSLTQRYFEPDFFNQELLTPTALDLAQMYPFAQSTTFDCVFSSSESNKSAQHEKKSSSLMNWIRSAKSSSKEKPKEDPSSFDEDDEEFRTDKLDVSEQLLLFGHYARFLSEADASKNTKSSQRAAQQTSDKSQALRMQTMRQSQEHSFSTFGKNDKEPHSSHPSSPSARQKTETFGEGNFGVTPVFSMSSPDFSPIALFDSKIASIRDKWNSNEHFPVIITFFSSLIELSSSSPLLVIFLILLIGHHPLLSTVASSVFSRLISLPAISQQTDSLLRTLLPSKPSPFSLSLLASLCGKEHISIKTELFRSLSRVVLFQPLEKDRVSSLPIGDSSAVGAFSSQSFGTSDCLYITSSTRTSMPKKDKNEKSRFLRRKVKEKAQNENPTENPQFHAPAAKQNVIGKETSKFLHSSENEISSYQPVSNNTASQLPNSLHRITHFKLSVFSSEQSIPLSDDSLQLPNKSQSQPDSSSALFFFCEDMASSFECTSFFERIALKVPFEGKSTPFPLEMPPHNSDAFCQISSQVIAFTSLTKIVLDHILSDTTPPTAPPTAPPPSNLADLPDEFPFLSSSVLIPLTNGTNKQSLASFVFRELDEPFGKPPFESLLNSTPFEQQQSPKENKCNEVKQSIQSSERSSLFLTSFITLCLKILLSGNHLLMWRACRAVTLLSPFIQSQFIAPLVTLLFSLATPPLPDSADQWTAKAGPFNLALSTITHSPSQPLPVDAQQQTQSTNTKFSEELTLPLILSKSDLLFQQTQSQSSFQTSSATATNNTAHAHFHHFVPTVVICHKTANEALIALTSLLFNNPAFSIHIPSIQKHICTTTTKLRADELSEAHDSIFFPVAFLLSHNLICRCIASCGHSQLKSAFSSRLRFSRVRSLIHSTPNPSYLFMPISVQQTTQSDTNSAQATKNHLGKSESYSASSSSSDSVQASSDSIHSVSTVSISSNDDQLPHEQASNSLFSAHSNDNLFEEQNVLPTAEDAQHLASCVVFIALSALSDTNSPEQLASSALSVLKAFHCDFLVEQYSSHLCASIAALIQLSDEINDASSEQLRQFTSLSSSQLNVAISRLIRQYLRLLGQTGVLNSQTENVLSDILSFVQRQCSSPFEHSSLVPLHLTAQQMSFYQSEHSLHSSPSTSSQTHTPHLGTYHVSSPISSTPSQQSSLSSGSLHSSPSPVITPLSSPSVRPLSPSKMTSPAPASSASPPLSPFSSTSFLSRAAHSASPTTHIQSAHSSPSTPLPEKSPIIRCEQLKTPKTASSSVNEYTNLTGILGLSDSDLKRVSQAEAIRNKLKKCAANDYLYISGLNKEHHLKDVENANINNLCRGCSRCLLENEEFEQYFVNNESSDCYQFCIKPSQLEFDGLKRPYFHHSFLNRCKEASISNNSDAQLKPSLSQKISYIQKSTSHINHLPSFFDYSADSPVTSMSPSSFRSFSPIPSSFCGSPLPSSMSPKRSSSPFSMKVLNSSSPNIFRRLSAFIESSTFPLLSSPVVSFSASSFHHSEFLNSIQSYQSRKVEVIDDLSSEMQCKWIKCEHSPCTSPAIINTAEEIAIEAMKACLYIVTGTVKDMRDGKTKEVISTVHDCSECLSKSTKEEEQDTLSVSTNESILANQSNLFLDFQRIDSPAIQFASVRCLRSLSLLSVLSNQSPFCSDCFFTLSDCFASLRCCLEEHTLLMAGEYVKMIPYCCLVSSSHQENHNFIPFREDVFEDSITSSSLTLHSRNCADALLRLLSIMSEYPTFDPHLSEFKRLSSSIHNSSEKIPSNSSASDSENIKGFAKEECTQMILEQWQSLLSVTIETAFILMCGVINSDSFLFILGIKKGGNSFEKPTSFRRKSSVSSIAERIVALIQLHNEQKALAIQNCNNPQGINYLKSEYFSVLELPSPNLLAKFLSTILPFLGCQVTSVVSSAVSVLCALSSITNAHFLLTVILSFFFRYFTEETQEDVALSLHLLHPFDLIHYLTISSNKGKISCSSVEDQMFDQLSILNGLVSLLIQYGSNYSMVKALLLLIEDIISSPFAFRSVSDFTQTPPLVNIPSNASTPISIINATRILIRSLKVAPNLTWPVFSHFLQIQLSVYPHFCLPFDIRSILHDSLRESPSYLPFILSDSAKTSPILLSAPSFTYFSPSHLIDAPPSQTETDSLNSIIPFFNTCNKTSSAFTQKTGNGSNSKQNNSFSFGFNSFLPQATKQVKSSMHPASASASASPVHLSLSSAIFATLSSPSNSSSSTILHSISPTRGGESSSEEFFGECELLNEEEMSIPYMYVEKQFRGKGRASGQLAENKFVATQLRFAGWVRQMTRNMLITWQDYEEDFAKAREIRSILAREEFEDSTRLEAEAQTSQGQIKSEEKIQGHFQHSTQSSASLDKISEENKSTDTLNSKSLNLNMTNESESQALPLFGWLNESDSDEAKALTPISTALKTPHDNFCGSREAWNDEILSVSMHSSGKANQLPDFDITRAELPLQPFVKAFPSVRMMGLSCEKGIEQERKSENIRYYGERKFHERLIGDDELSMFRLPFRTIELDVKRTTLVSSADGGHTVDFSKDDVRELLMRFVVRCPEIGFLQGMSYPAALVTLFGDKFGAYELFTNIVLSPFFTQL
eukprot:MONOS_7912.1-p1 / transcript=MONOS_7912.1 / gene=MONOS_7912 / organism=Monocercomonoides_exilis_PA203 / gene_product=unspecified product / transcript_product=unspecified product / location=Mono_scaffold00284:30094-43840(-) / protein_length=4550 / sequence_SO=supercontig / SO=protein_coding / is_pseudo=false